VRYEIARYLIVPQTRPLGKISFRRGRHVFKMRRGMGDALILKSATQLPEHNAVSLIM
jgi:hypothetical protein